MLGLFSPARHDLREYMKYDITLFRDNIRFLEVVLNRNGASNSICPLYFDGKISYFEELPLPQNVEELQPFYDKGLFTVLALNEISYSEPNNLD